MEKTKAEKKAQNLETLEPWCKVWCSECKVEKRIKLSEKEKHFPRYICDVCRKKELVKRMNRIIPLKFRKLATDKEELLKKCKDKSVFCYGPAGTGKTVFITSLVRAYIRIEKRVCYLSYPAFIMKLRNSYRKERTGDRKTPWDIAEETASFTGILFLDDLGAEKTTDFVREITYFILNEREINLLTTIITSNFSLDELNDTIDPRISSRIAGMCEILKFTGKDRRIEKK